MDITQVITLIKEETAKVVVIFITTSLFNLLVNKVFIEPLVTKWGSNLSRRIVPYVINKLDPIAPEAISELTPEELENLIFEEIVNAPGSPQWMKEASNNNSLLTQRKKKTIRKIFEDVIKEYDITKAAAKTGRTMHSEGDKSLENVRRRVRKLEKRALNRV